MTTTPEGSDPNQIQIPAPIEHDHSVPVLPPVRQDAGLGLRPGDYSGQVSVPFDYSPAAHAAPKKNNTPVILLGVIVGVLALILAVVVGSSLSSDNSATPTSNNAPVGDTYTPDSAPYTPDADKFNAIDSVMERVWGEMLSSDQEELCLGWNIYQDSMLDAFMEGESTGLISRSQAKTFFDEKC